MITVFQFEDTFKFNSILFIFKDVYHVLLQRLHLTLDSDFDSTMYMCSDLKAAFRSPNLL